MLIRVVFIVPEISFFKEKNPIVDFFKLPMIWNLLHFSFVFDFSDQAFLICYCFTTFEWVGVLVPPTFRQINQPQPLENSFTRSKLYSPLKRTLIPFNLHVIQPELKRPIKMNSLSLILVHPKIARPIIQNVEIDVIEFHLPGVIITMLDLSLFTWWVHFLSCLRGWENDAGEVGAFELACSVATFEKDDFCVAWFDFDFEICAFVWMDGMEIFELGKLHVFSKGGFFWVVLIVEKSIFTFWVCYWKASKDIWLSFLRIIFSLRFLNRTRLKHIFKDILMWVVILDFQLHRSISVSFEHKVIELLIIEPINFNESNVFSWD